MTGRWSPRPSSISAKVWSGDNECGLIGLALHPDYAKNHRFFVNYDVKESGQIRTHISEFLADESGTHADPASEKILLTYDQPYGNHKGGAIIFGKDGMLYIGAGDGGSGGDPLQNGQNLGVLLGKIMRIDVDHGQPYTVPKDNPFVGQAGARPEIWCYGLRNPWRFTLDRATGQIWCGDVGQNIWEEIDLIEKGKNYGWSAREGKHDFKPERAKGPFTEPIKDYPHSEGNCVIGGYVYHGKAIPGLEGMYVYADYTRGWIGGLRYDGKQVTFDAHLMETPIHPAAFGEDHNGELYICDRDGGRLFMIGP